MKKTTLKKHLELKESINQIVETYFYEVVTEPRWAEAVKNIAEDDVKSFLVVKMMNGDIFSFTITAENYVGVPLTRGFYIIVDVKITEKDDWKSLVFPVFHNNNGTTTNADNDNYDRAMGIL